DAQPIPRLNATGKGDQYDRRRTPKLETDAVLDVPFRSNDMSAYKTTPRIVCLVSQRDSASKPKVGRNDLPWVNTPNCHPTPTGLRPFNPRNTSHPTSTRASSTTREPHPEIRSSCDVPPTAPHRPSPDRDSTDSRKNPRNRPATQIYGIPRIPPSTTRLKPASTPSPIPPA
ncbi:MAG: hypothetical protein ACI8V5_001487, partial [Limisphaerales bacterium]